jgi:hypothetical protein
MKEYARGSSVYWFWMDSPETQEAIAKMREEERARKDLEEKYKKYYETVKACQDACDHDIQDGYCFLCNKFFNEDDSNG